MQKAQFASIKGLLKLFIAGIISEEILSESLEYLTCSKLGLPV